MYEMPKQVRHDRQRGVMTGHIFMEVIYEYFSWCFYSFDYTYEG